MSDQPKMEVPKGLPPGVCLPWEQNLKDYGPLTGDEGLIKNEWEKLDAFAYIYLWWWVHR